jgi:hypothetical protein
VGEKLRLAELVPVERLELLRDMRDLPLGNGAAE